MKRVFAIICVFILTLSMTSFAFADPEQEASGQTKTEQTTETVEEGKATDLSTAEDRADEQYGITDEIKDPNYLLGIEEEDILSVDEINDRINTKGAQVVSILKTVGQYVCLATFIISLIVGVASAIFKGTQSLVIALLVAVGSGVAYACLVSGEEIFAAIVQFIRT